jgi:hypothetical protein
MTDCAAISKLNEDIEAERKKNREKLNGDLEGELLSKLDKVVKEH